MRAFKAADAVGDADAPCRQTIGPKNALALVRYCLFMSPATHPPCNSGNDCALIVEEIRRSCPATRYAELPCENGMTPAKWRQIAGLKAQ